MQLILLEFLYLFDFIQLLKHPYRTALLQGQVAAYRFDGVAHLGRLGFAAGGDGVEVDLGQVPVRQYPHQLAGGERLLHIKFETVQDAKTSIVKLAQGLGFVALDAAIKLQHPPLAAIVGERKEGRIGAAGEDQHLVLMQSKRR